MLVRSCFLIILIKCLKGHKSLGHSVMSKAKVSDWVSEWQGHRNWPIYGWRNTRPGCDTESWEQCKELTWTRLRGNQQLHQDPSKRKGKRLTRWWDRPLRIDELKRQLTVCQWKLSRIAAGCQEEESCWERLHQSFQSVNQWKEADVKNNEKMQFLKWFVDPQIMYTLPLRSRCLVLVHHNNSHKSRSLPAPPTPLWPTGSSSSAFRWWACPSWAPSGQLLAEHWSWRQACCCYPACVPTHAKTPRQGLFHRKLKSQKDGNCTMSTVCR